jgi:hypothetical protein
MRGVVFLLAVGMAAAPGCATSGGSGSSSGNPFRWRLAELLYMPPDFHPSHVSGPPDSWSVYSAGNNGGVSTLVKQLFSDRPVGPEQLTFEYMAVRQADYARKGTLPSDVVIIVVGPKPAESPRTNALEAEKAAHSQCAGPLNVSHNEIRSTSDDYIFDAVGAPCGSDPNVERVVRLTYGQYRAYKISYVKKGGTLNPKEKDQAVQVVSSFTIGECPSPSADCSLPIFFGVGTPPAGITP